MSPTVPPISAITTSAPDFRPSPMTRSLISFVMCGIICTVPPR